MKLLVGLVLFCHCLTGQKLVRKTLVNKNQQYIQVDTKNCFTTTITATAVEELQVEAAMEGEYANDLAIRITEDGANVLVSADFLPNFKNPNDKLSAHKVVSIALRINVPIDSNVLVYGTNSEIISSGQFKNLKVVLADGPCSLNHATGNIDIKTQNGHINAVGLVGDISAITTYGKLTIGKELHGFYDVKLTSVSGNISVNNTK